MKEFGAPARGRTWFERWVEWGEAKKLISELLGAWGIVCRGISSSFCVVCSWVWAVGSGSCVCGSAVGGCGVCVSDAINVIYMAYGNIWNCLFRCQCNCVICCSWLCCRVGGYGAGKSSALLFILRFAFSTTSHRLRQSFLLGVCLKFNKLAFYCGVVRALRLHAAFKWIFCLGNGKIYKTKMSRAKNDFAFCGFFCVDFGFLFLLLFVLCCLCE